MKIVLLDTATLGEDLELSPITRLGSATEYKSTLPEQVAERLTDAEVVVVNKIKLNESNLSAASALKLICVTATGYDNIDTAYCRARGIALCNVPGYSTDSVAQLTLAMALSLVGHLTEYRRFVHSGEYSQLGVANSLVPVYHELSSLTWGVVGGGAIGTRVAELASAFGSHILMHRRAPDSRYEQVGIDELCRRSDIISLHVPLNDGTHHLINRERLALMKSNAILINVARGAVTDEEALTEAMEQGRIGGLGIDVYSREPFDKQHPFHRLLNHDRVCLTPHMAWGSAEARARCVATIAHNITAFFDGREQNRVV